jgi:hypothetical protein
VNMVSCPFELAILDLVVETANSLDKDDGDDDTIQQDWCPKDIHNAEARVGCQSIFTLSRVNHFRPLVVCALYS